MTTRTSRSIFRTILVAVVVSVIGFGAMALQAAPPCKKASGCRGRLTVSTGRKVVYYRTSPLRERNPSVKTAVIVVHGLSRNADDYFERVVKAAELSGKLGSTIVIAPRFQKKEDNPRSDEHYWKGGWSKGDLSQDSPRFSSFAVVDHIFSQLSRRDRFPNLKRIVLAGHSAGGQFVNRYAASGKATAAKGLQVRFLVMNPSSFLYLGPRRVGSNGKLVFPKVAGANDYKYGLRKLNNYASKVGTKGMIARMTSRRVYYLGGTADTGTSNLDTSDPGKAQGRNRYHRFLNYQIFVNKFVVKKWRNNAIFVKVPNIGHSGSKMFASSQARSVMFK